MMERAHDPEQKIAERYFLGELSDAEAEAFEAHYFECHACAEDVVETQMLFDSGRAVAREQKTVHAPQAPASVVQLDEARKRRRQWIPAAVAAMLVVTVAAPLLMRGPAEPTEVAEVQLITTVPTIKFAQNRDAASAELVFKAGVPFELNVQVPPSSGGSTVELSVRRVTTKSVVKPPIPLSEELMRDPIRLALMLPAGEYEVVIESVQGKRREEMHTQGFRVAPKQ